jgi:cyclopropane-fatty-acyl-phospholipid synthase
MRNWEVLLERIASWLAPEGRLFVHVFCHREHAYAFETDGQSDWMARHFFTGGIMPSFDLLPSLDRHLVTASTWRVNGGHYAKTLLAWLDTMDRERRRALEILRGVHGDRLAARWLHRWRIFFLASAELFAYGGGDEWPVAHYLLAPRRTP